MSLSTFLDIVWAEIWDDVSPMGDRSRYRQIIVELFVEGKDPYDITWRDSDNKLQRLSNQRMTTKDSKPARSSLDQAREWQEALRKRKQDLVESGSDATSQ